MGRAKGQFRAGHHCKWVPGVLGGHLAGTGLREKPNPVCTPPRIRWACQGLLDPSRSLGRLTGKC